MTDTDQVLNTVDKPPFPCPTCDRASPMYVLVDRVIWFCGHSRPLPPMHNHWGNQVGAKRKTKPVDDSVRVQPQGTP